MEQTTSAVVWLKGNQRVMWLSMIVPGLLICVGALVLILAGATTWGAITGGVLAGLGVILALLIFRTGRLPRIVWRESQVDFYLPGPQPISVPLEFVECFFLGSGVTTLPGSSTRDVQTRNLVVRIAERATDWQHRELPLHLGKWCEGYLTIRGLYCEVLDLEVIKRLNTALHQAQHAPVCTTTSCQHPQLVQGQLLETSSSATDSCPN
jgi:multisubunit Na+/H+ antiporter MnhB subunit